VQPTSRYSIDELHLLAKAKIDPESLVDSTQRMSIENRLMTKEILSIDDTAILELLLRLAEMDSGIHSVDQERQAMLKKRIQEGQLRSFKILSLLLCSLLFRLHMQHAKAVLGPYTA
jgi:hypothetical protein